MDVQCILVPYDSGLLDTRMGKGPAKLLEGLDWLRERGTLEVERLEMAATFPTEIGGTFTLARLLAERVSYAVANGRFPLVLTGNCFSAVGILSGLFPARTSVVWLDCHGDFNTPETTQSGFLDGMGLATVLGSCWTKISATVPGFRTVPGRQVLHLGGRDFDVGERARMEQAGIGVFGAEAFRDGAIPDLAPVLQTLAQSPEGIYVHIDLDVLDPSEAPTNMFQKPGGLSALQLENVLGIIGSHMPVRAATFSAYDPSCDLKGHTSAIAQHLLRHVLAAAETWKTEQRA
jgi:arginase